MQKVLQLLGTGEKFYGKKKEPEGSPLFIVCTAYCQVQVGNFYGLYEKTLQRVTATDWLSIYYGRYGIPAIFLTGMGCRA